MSNKELLQSNNELLQAIYDALESQPTYEELTPSSTCSEIESEEYPGCYYRTVDDVTEWVNPPMILNTEYRTTEKWNGQPVYTKLITLTENEPYELNPLQMVFEMVGMCGLLPLPINYGLSFTQGVDNEGYLLIYENTLSLYISDGLKTDFGFGSNNSAVVKLKYYYLAD